jgi:hypothetical protein
MSLKVENHSSIYSIYRLKKRGEMGNDYVWVIMRDLGKLPLVSSQERSRSVWLNYFFFFLTHRLLGIK